MRLSRWTRGASEVGPASFSVASLSPARDRLSGSEAGFPRVTVNCSDPDEAMGLPGRTQEDRLSPCVITSGHTFR